MYMYMHEIISFSETNNFCTRVLLEKIQLFVCRPSDFVNQRIKSLGSGALF